MKNEEEKTREPRFKGEVTEERHKNMSRIRGRDTSIEILLRKALWSKGFRYRKNYKKLPGKPDVALTKYKIAVFCDSEFFHGKNWPVLKKKLGNGSNPDYWVPKIERNIERDRENDILLKSLGWSVVHFWGNEIKKDLSACIQVIEELIFEMKISEGNYNDE